MPEHDRPPLARIRLPLTTDRLLLRLPRRSDLPTLLRLLNDPEIIRFTATGRRPRRAVEAWIRGAPGSARRGERLSMLLLPLDGGGTPMGGVTLRSSDHEGTVDLGYWVGRPFRRRGFAVEAIRAAARAAFLQGRLHRLSASIFPENVASEAVLSRIGFRPEGRSRGSFRKDGRWRDEVHFGLLGDELR